MNRKWTLLVLLSAVAVMLCACRREQTDLQSTTQETTTVSGSVVPSTQPENTRSETTVPSTEPQNETAKDPQKETSKDPQKENQSTEPQKGTQPTEPQPTEPQKETQPTEPQKETQPTQPQKETQPTQPQEETQPTEPKPTEPVEGEIITPPEELPPTVEIPPQKDPETGASLGITFPCQVAQYDLVIEKLAPYSGLFVEDGTNAQVQNVAMLMVQNKGDYPVEYTSIKVTFGQEELLFDISALPAGETLVVQEKNGKAVPTGKADAATALVVRRAEMEMSEGQVQVIDNGDNSLTVKNLTDTSIPTVRIFYKYYMEDEGIFVGGIAFTVRITRLGAGASVRIQPAHYNSQTSRVVMVLTYDSEV